MIPIAPIFLYAELHYCLPFLKSRYFIRQPEIVFDIPIRVIKTQKKELEVLLFIKDAHQFPINIYNLQWEIYHKERIVKAGVICLNRFIDSSTFSQIVEIPFSPEDCHEYYELNCILQYSVNRKDYTCVNDNYPLLDRKRLCFYLTDEPLPYPENWFAGDPHYHSIYTSDQVEYGADILSTKTFAKTMGLSWFFVTDHSYDLDDLPDNYLKTDVTLTKWKNLIKECSELDEPSFRVISGEEVSIGNKKGHNLHLLAINHPFFIPGRGDSMETTLDPTPTLSLDIIPSLQDETNLFIAAHPVERIPLSQKLLLKRNEWSLADYKSGNIQFLQIINCNSYPLILRHIEIWTSYLLSNHRFFMVAGNDAHGNFNYMKQIRSPFTTMHMNRKQLFGQAHTVFQYPSNDPIKGIKNKRIIVSNGVFLSITLQNDSQIAYIGEEVSSHFTLCCIEAKTSHETGQIRWIHIHIGDLSKRKEKTISCNELKIELELPSKGYVRASLLTYNGHWAFTNPIWIK